MKHWQSSLPLRYTLFYAVISALWILFTDHLLHYLINNPHWHLFIAMSKGWGFVLVTATLLYILLTDALRERQQFNLELETHARQQEAVTALQQRALSCTDESVLFQEAAMLISLTLDVEYSAIMELCSDGQTLHLRACTGWPDSLADMVTTSTVRNTLIGYTLRQAEPVVSEHLQTENRFVVPACLADHGLVSSLSVSIPGPRQPFGALGVYSKHRRIFTQDERQFLTTIANVLATAISRGRAEAELRLQKTLLECQSEAALDGIVVLDTERRVLSFNQRFVAMWNIPLSIMARCQGDAILEVMKERVADPQQFEARLLALSANTGGKSRDEVLLQDGRIFDLYSAPVEDHSGICYGRVCYYRDITDIRRAQEALREREEMFRMLVSSMDDIVFTLDREQRHTGVFGRWLERFGLSPEVFLGKTSRQILTDDATIALHEAANAQALAGEDVVYEWQLPGPDNLTYIQASLSPIRNSQGEVTGLVGVGRDITALKQAEEAYRVLVEHSLQGLTIFQDQHIVFANQAMAALTGYTVEELQSMAADELRNLIYLDDSASMWEYVSACLSGQPVPSIYEHRIVRKDNQVRWVEATGFPIQYRGKIAIQGAFIDITGRKQVEAEIKRHNQELAALNRITESVNMFLELPGVLATLRTLLAEYLHIPAGLIFLYHEEQDSLSLQLSWGISLAQDTAFQRMPVTNAYNERVVRTRMPVLLHSLPVEWNWLSHEAWNGHSHLCSYLGVPMLAQGELQGVLDLFNPSMKEFNADQVAFFTIVGQQVGAAIQKARLFNEVHTGRQRLQTLSHRLVEVQETERRAIARELHDEIGQILTGVNLILELVARLPVEQARTRLDQAQNLVNELMLRVREMSLELRPPMLDDLGLLPALLWHFERYTEQTNIRVTFKHSGLERRFPPQIEIVAYRVIQEALTNVARHAEVPDVTVRTWANHRLLGVQVEDRGRGFEPHIALENHASSGLSGIRERTLLLGGQFLIEAVPGHGCCLSIELPLEEGKSI